MRWLPLVTALLLITAHHLPAPIQEESTPTPAPERSAKPKAKRATNSKTNTAEPESSAKIRSRATPVPTPAKKFAGTWKGTLSGQQWTIVIEPNEAQAGASGGPWGTEPGTTRINQNTISWNYVFNSWSLTVVPGTKTAQVTVHYIGGTSSGIFERNE
jgi:hypothetical protein